MITVLHNNNNKTKHIEIKYIIIKLADYVLIKIIFPFIF